MGQPGTDGGGRSRIKYAEPASGTSAMARIGFVQMQTAIITPTGRDTAIPAMNGRRTHMNKRKTIAEILHDRFSGVYCDSCDSEKSAERCDYCNRKSMNWKLSEKRAYAVADEIITALKDTAS